MLSLGAATLLAALCSACMITTATTARTAFAANPARAHASPGLRPTAAICRCAVPEARRTRVHAAAGARALVDVAGEGGGDTDARITVLKAKLATALQDVVRESPRPP